MSVALAFKRFNFFQPEQVQKHAFPANASCVVPGGGLLWVGTDSGGVVALDARLGTVALLPAHGHKVLEVLWLPVSSMGCPKYTFIYHRQGQ
jgi:hypothetical protein